MPGECLLRQNSTLKLPRCMRKQRRTRVFPRTLEPLLQGRPIGFICSPASEQRESEQRESEVKPRERLRNHHPIHFGFGASSDGTVEPCGALYKEYVGTLQR